MTFWRLPTRATVAISSLSILTGCSQPAEVINHERITSALHIQVTPTHATPTKLEFDYVISNNTGEDVWAVALPEAAVVTDPSTTNGVIFAQIFFPVDRDLEFYTPPSTLVQLVGADQSINSSLAAKLPLQPYQDHSNEPRALPAEIKSARLCLAYVRDTELSAGAKPSADLQSGDSMALSRAVGSKYQEFSCSDAIELS